MGAEGAKHVADAIATNATIQQLEYAAQPLSLAVRAL